MQIDDNGFVESQVSEEPKQGQQPQEQEQKLSQQEEDQEKFHLLIDELFDELRTGNGAGGSGVDQDGQRALVKTGPS